MPQIPHVWLVVNASWSLLNLREQARPPAVRERLVGVSPMITATKLDPPRPLADTACGMLLATHDPYTPGAP